MPRSTTSPDLKHENRLMLPPIHVQIVPKAKVNRSQVEAVTVSSLPSIAVPSSCKELSVVSQSAPVKTNGETPYRLPKITTRSHFSSKAARRIDDLYKIDDDDDDRSSAIVHYIRNKNMLMPPYTISQLQRANSLMVPTFRRAHLAPMTPAPSIATASDQTYTRLDRILPKLRIGTTSVNGFERNQRGTLFRDSKVTWKLSPHTNKSYDSKAGGGYSGPYSREFTIHCTAPNSWLRKKWKRQSTTLR